jgi:hypothetical protein
MNPSHSRDTGALARGAELSQPRGLSVMIGNTKIGFELRSSNRRTLAITVRPDAAVVVTAPVGLDRRVILRKVQNRASWILKQKALFEGYLPSVPPRKFVSGETHRYLGRQYRLKFIKSSSSDVTLKGSFIWVHLPRKKNSKHAQALVENWYMKRAKERLFISFQKGVARFGTQILRPPEMRLRRMAKRWGSWTKRGIVYLNPELIKAPLSCIDYVVTHELCHAIHGNHSKLFFDTLLRMMPDWQVRKMRLERLISD